MKKHLFLPELLAVSRINGKLAPLFRQHLPARCATFIVVLLLIGTLSGWSETEEESTPNTATAQIEEEKAVPEIVARIGDDVITGKEFQQDLQYRWQLMSAQKGEAFVPDAQFKQDTLEELINGRILFILARNHLKNPVTDAEIDAEFKKGKASLGTEEAYQNYLTMMGLDEAGVRSEIKRRLTVERFTEEKTKDVAVNEDELKEAFEQWKEAGHLERKTLTVDFLHLFCRAQKTDEAATKALERIQKAREEILAGKDFEAVVQEVSDDLSSKAEGGLYYEVPLGRMPPQVDEKLLSLPIGEVSDVLYSFAGWHVVKVLQRNEAGGQIPYEKVRTTLEKKLLVEKRKEVLNTLIVEAKNLLNIEIISTGKK